MGTNIVLCKRLQINACCLKGPNWPKDKLNNSAKFYKDITAYKKAHEVGGTKDVVRRGSIGHSQILGLTLLKQTHQLLFLTNINTNTFKCIKFPSDKQLNNVIARIDITKRHAHICCH